MITPAVSKTQNGTLTKCTKNFNADGFEQEREQHYHHLEYILDTTLQR